MLLFLRRSTRGVICHLGDRAVNRGVSSLNLLVCRILGHVTRAAPNCSLLRHIFRRRCRMIGKTTVLHPGRSVATGDIRGRGSPSTSCQGGKSRGMGNCDIGVARAYSSASSRGSGPGLVMGIRIGKTDTTSGSCLGRTVAGVHRGMDASAVRGICTSKTCRSPNGEKFTSRGSVRLVADKLRKERSGCSLRVGRNRLIIARIRAKRVVPTCGAKSG